MLAAHSLRDYKSLESRPRKLATNINESQSLKEDFLVVCNLSAVTLFTIESIPQGSISLLVRRLPFQDFSPFEL